MQPKYDLDKIKFATDEPTLEKAIQIYDSGGIKNFKDVDFGFEAMIRGSKGNFYKVYISAKDYDCGNCGCYLGEQDILCKHMVVAAIYAVMAGKKLNQEDREFLGTPKCSGKLGELGVFESGEVKAEITTAMRFIKPYNGPSSVWFQYQNSLSEGCNRLSKIFSGLPISRQTAKLLIDTLLRLDRKLCEGGVDDSDGTVGGFIEETTRVLMEYANLDPSCVEAFRNLAEKETCFGWEKSLLELFREQE